MIRQRATESFSSFALRCEVARHSGSIMSRDDAGSVLASVAMWHPHAINAVGAMSAQALGEALAAIVADQSALKRDPEWTVLVDASRAGHCSGFAYTCGVIAEVPGRRVRLVNLVQRHTSYGSLIALLRRSGVA